MKTTKPIVILLTLVLLIAAGAQSSEKPAKKEISNTRTASCLVKITTDSSVLPLSDIIIDYLLHSSGVAGKAAREILDISPDDTFQLFTIEDLEKYSAGLPRSSSRSTTATTRRPPPGGSLGGYDDYYRKPKPTSGRSIGTTAKSPTSAVEQTYLLKLQVDLVEEDGPIKPAAEEFMIALIENLRSVLRGVFDQYSAKLNKQLNHAAEEAHHAERHLVAMQAELREISDSRDLSRYVILRDISSLRQKLQSTTMQRASDETLYEATAKRIAETKDKRKQRADNDSITSELRSMLYVHEKGLQEAQKLYDAGNASLANIQDLKEKIVRAKIELAQRREQIINPAGGVEISSLNDELATLSIQTDLAQQEMKILEVQLEKAKGLLKIADRYELLSLKADIAKQGLEETLLWHARLGRNNRSIQPPDVTVIGAE